MPLTSIDRVLAWCKKEDLAQERQPELLRCIGAASDILAGITGRVLDRVTRSIVLDGDDASGAMGGILFLPPGDRPVLHSTTPNLVTVTESGISLTVTTGYTASDAVVVKNANADRPCQLVRPYGSWLRGMQNIVVGYKCGWTIDVPADPAPVPERVIQLVNALAWMLFQEPAWVGKLNVSQQGSAVTLSSELPDYEASTLHSLMVL